MTPLLLLRIMTRGQHQARTHSSQIGVYKTTNLPQLAARFPWICNCSFARQLKVPTYLGSLSAILNIERVTATATTAARASCQYLVLYVTNRFVNQTSLSRTKL